MGTELTTDDLNELLGSKEVVNIVSSRSLDSIAATSILIKIILDSGSHFKVHFKDFPVEDTDEFDIAVDNNGLGLRAGEKSCSQKAYSIAKEISEDYKDLGYLPILGSQKVLTREKYLNILKDIIDESEILESETDSNLYGKYGSLKSILMHPYNPRLPGLNKERAVKRFLEKRDLDPESKFYELDDESRSDFNSALIMYLMRNEQKETAQNLIQENAVFKGFSEGEPRRYANDHSLVLESISSKKPGNSVGAALGNKSGNNIDEYLNKISENVQNFREHYLDCEPSLSYGVVNALLKRKKISLTVSSNSEYLMVIGMSDEMNVAKKFSRVSENTWGTSRMAKAFIDEDEKDEFFEEVIR